MDIPPSVTAAIGIATPIALGAWHVYQYITVRRDQQAQRRDQQRDQQDEREAALLTKQRELMASENAAVFTSVRAELQRKSDALDACERDRSASYALARAWFRLAHDMVGRALEREQVAEIACRKAGLPKPTWSGGNLELPPFDTPSPWPREP